MKDKRENDTMVRADWETRSRLKVQASERGLSIKAYLKELAAEKDKEKQK